MMTDRLMLASLSAMPAHVQRAAIARAHDGNTTELARKVACKLFNLADTAQMTRERERIPFAAFALLPKHRARAKAFAALSSERTGVGSRHSASDSRSSANSRLPRAHQRAEECGMVNRVIRSYGAIALALLACGGRGRDAERESMESADPELAEPAATDTGAAGAGSASTSDMGSAALQLCFGPIVDDAAVVASLCRACVPGAVPRCIDRPIPKPETEPPACAAPSCEVPASMGLRGFFGDAAVFRGSCADGKSFEATLGTLEGVVYYYRDGQGQVGRAAYSNTIGDCACSGENFSGDVLCPSPTFETEPAGELRLPFADGRPSAPCMCAD